jgi:hypothetical protein
MRKTADQRVSVLQDGICRIEGPVPGGFRAVLVSFIRSCDQIPKKTNLREERFILAHALRHSSLQSLASLTQGLR